MTETYDTLIFHIEENNKYSARTARAHTQTHYVGISFIQTPHAPLHRIPFVC